MKIFSNNELAEYIAGIRGLDMVAVKKAESYAESLAAPPGSLGKLVEFGIQLSGITGKLHNHIRNKRIIVFCADNGVIAEGVSSAPQSVTISQAINMTKGLTGMSSMARYFNAGIEVVDVGICADYECSGILNMSIRKGTENIAEKPAMTRREALAAISTGIYIAEKAANERMDVIGIGEMGIGNTTTSAAVLAAILEESAETVTGHGGGITPEAFEKKKKIVDSAIKLHKPNSSDIVDVLQKVGGLDLAAMCGAFLGAAKRRIPVVIDGFISIVAALCAEKMKRECTSFMFPSHASQERGYRIAAEELRLDTWMDLGLRLGEGSGCPLGFEMLCAVTAIMNDMATFDLAGIDDGYLEDIRGNEEAVD